MTASDSTPGNGQERTDSIATEWTTDGDGAGVEAGRIEDHGGDVETGATADAVSVPLEEFTADREECLSVFLEATEGTPVMLSSMMSRSDAREVAYRLLATTDEWAECREDNEADNDAKA